MTTAAEASDARIAGWHAECEPLQRARDDNRRRRACEDACRDGDDPAPDDETRDVGYPYYPLRDRFLGPEARSLRSVPRGEGRIVEIGGARVAAYRDDNGRVTRVSSVCTHMGCEVKWNSAERTWDCPCHGSRFTPQGKVLAGPAESPLEPVEDTK